MNIVFHLFRKLIGNKRLKNDVNTGDMEACQSAHLFSDFPLNLLGFVWKREAVSDLNLYFNANRMILLVLFHMDPLDPLTPLPSE